VIRGGRPVLSSAEHIADVPLLIPTIAVSSIGAGGGSILWLDPTGSLKVGPRSVCRSMPQADAASAREAPSSGSPSFLADYIYLGDRPVGLVLPGAGLVYYHGDQLTTPQLVTGNLSAIQWTGTYQPFGTVAITGSIAQNLRFPGQYADAETGWSNNGFRTYAPDLGRYIQADPIGLKGGINNYLYVQGNPIILTDPTGLAENVCARGPSKSKREECLEKCLHLLPSPSGDLQSSEFRKCYRECIGSL
jgi:RHS repeat-associated protein